ncbi:hypothetical protein CFAM422_009059 [Trichoderma lentiforme]|uniref:Uncharacterized protein n=1 Tax=Trichoderma lentiforme TaxID=1567552 RepID=A0A9P4XAS4_9HYPO|nr:hypothetical protein CFAM422_009059 [Trichoderma lentiforme]
MARLRERFFAHPGPKLTYRLPGVCGIAYAPRLTIWARFPGHALVLDKASIVTSIIMGIPRACYQQCPVTPLLLPYDILVRRQSKHKHRFGLTNGLPQGIAVCHVSDVACLAATCLLVLARRPSYHLMISPFFSVASFSPACLNRSL